MKKTILVWDSLVRVFHWSLVLAFVIALVTSEDMEKLHIKVGYIIFGLVCFRLVWGFVGPHYARFSQFIKSPATIFSYFKDVRAKREKRYIGHNPAGGAMIIIMILGLFAISVTGWMSTIDMFKGADWVEEAHEICTFIFLFAIIAHVSGVIIESIRHKENLVIAMISGYKKSPSKKDIV